MQSKNYTFIFITIVIVIAALLLATASTLLKDRQNANIANEKKEFILRAAGVDTKTGDISKMYSDFIEQKVIDEKGNEITGVDAFKIELEKQAKAKNADPNFPLQLPLYTYKDPKGTTRYVFPVTGKGLWGPIWGYVSLESDMSTVYNVIFDHKGETPGLGAEISALEFQKQFVGKKIYNDQGELISIDVLKGAGNTLDQHSVDGVSGGTITSVGVEKMLYRDFHSYQAFLEKKRAS